MLVVFEGIDGGGKETQIRLLREALAKKGKTLTALKYPTRKTQILNDYLEKKAIVQPKSLFLLFLADIAEDQENVRKALSSYDVVVLDRYVFSTIAYEVDSIDYARGKRIVESVEYIRPDMVVLLDLDPKLSQERKRKQKALDRYEENVSYLAGVRKNFLKLAEERFLTPNWHRVDAGKTIEAVHTDIMDFF
ncbi:MAG: dTMP kinase [Candidatus Micrarchaeia archaeon]